MATGRNISRKLVVKAIRNYQQKVNFFKWKVHKYQDASDTYFMEANYKMMDLCDDNIAAYKKALKAAESALGRMETMLPTCKQ